MKKLTLTLILVLTTLVVGVNYANEIVITELPTELTVSGTVENPQVYVMQFVDSGAYIPGTIWLTDADGNTIGFEKNEYALKISCSHAVINFNQNWITSFASIAIKYSEGTENVEIKDAVITGIKCISLQGTNHSINNSIILQSESGGAIVVETGSGNHSIFNNIIGTPRKSWYGIELNGIGNNQVYENEVNVGMDFVPSIAVFSDNNIIDRNSGNTFLDGIRIFSGTGNTGSENNFSSTLGFGCHASCYENGNYVDSLNTQQGTTSVDQLNQSTPTHFQLSQNYPNPFNPTTTISYQLSQADNVKLVIYNTTGQVVATLVNEQQSAGDHSVQFVANHLPSGIYFYRLHTSQETLSGKMHLMK